MSSTPMAPVSLDNTLNGMDPQTLSEALAAMQAEQLAQQSAQANQAAQQAGQQYQQAAQAPPPGLDAMSAFIPQLLSNVASVIGKEPSYRENRQDVNRQQQADLLKNRADNLQALRDVWSQKAEVAKQAGDLETTEKAHTKREQIDKALQQILDKQKHEYAMTEIQERNKKPAGGGGIQTRILDQSDPEAIAEGIIRGDLHPDTSKLGRVVGPVVAGILARKGFKQTRALQDYNAVARHFATLNGRLQLQIRQSANTVQAGLNDVEGLANKLYEIAPSSRSTPLNRLIVKGTREWGLLSPEAQDIATQLNGQVATLIPELSNIYSAGGVPTDQAMRLAERVISADWPPNRIKAGIARERANLQYRINSINQVGAATPSSVEAGGYQTEARPSEVPAIKTTGTLVKMKDKKGKTRVIDLVEVPDAVKNGWTKTK